MNVHTVFSRWLLLCLCVLSAHSTLGVTFLRFRNGGASQNLYVGKNGSLLTTYGTGTGESGEISIGGELEEDDEIRIWKGSFNGTPVFRDDGLGAAYTATGATASGQRLPTASARWDTDEVAPPTYWCFTAILKNTTAASGQYAVYYNAPGGPPSLVGLFMVAAGASQTVEISMKTAPGVVTVVTPPAQGAIYLGDGMYADSEPTFTFIADGAHSAWFVCGGTPDDVEVEEGPNLIPLSENAPIDFAGEGATINPDLATEGTVQTGFNALAALEQAMLKKMIAELKGQGNSLKASELTAEETKAVLTATKDQMATAHTAQLSALEGIRTNSPGQRVAGDGQGVSTNFAGIMSGATNGFGDLLGGVGNMKNDMASVSNMVGTLSGMAGEHSGSFWTIAMPGSALIDGGANEIDFDPMTGMVGTVATWCRGIVAWLSLLLVVYAMVTDVRDFVYRVGAFQQGKSPVVGFSVAGFGFNSSLPTHAVIMAIILAALASALLVVFTYLLTFTGELWITTNPFSAPAGAASVPIKEGIWLLLRWIPLEVMLVHFFANLIFHFVLITVGISYQVVVRSMPSCIVFCFLTLQAFADDFTVKNFSGSTRYVGTTNGTWFAVPAGEVFELPGWSAPLEVWDASSNILAVVDQETAPFMPGTDQAPVLVLAGPTVTVIVEETPWTYFEYGMLFGSGIFGWRLTLYVLRLLRANQEGGVL